jgi:hypothetical protein
VQYIICLIALLALHRCPNISISSLIEIKQEQNAQIPPQLVTASNTVGSTSDNLKNVAENIAERGYSAYPDIQKHILSAGK